MLAHFPEKYAKVWNTFTHELKQIYMTQEQWVISFGKTAVTQICMCESVHFIYLFICVFFVCYFVFPFTFEWKIIEVSALFLSSVPQPSWNWPSGPPGKYIGLLNTGQRKSCQPAWLPSYTQHLLPSHTNPHHLISGCLQVNCVLIRTKCTQLSMIYI